MYRESFLILGIQISSPRRIIRTDQRLIKLSGLNKHSQQANNNNGIYYSKNKITK
jgi:hypothetical protein